MSTNAVEYETPLGGRIVISQQARIHASTKDVTIEITEQPDGGVEIVRGRHQ